MAEKKKQKKNIILRILTSPITINLFMMVGVFFILIIITLFGLKIYTKHNESIPVPSVKGLQVNDAVGILRTKDLSCEVIDSLYTMNGIPGAILEQIPKENSKVKKGRTIYLTIQAKSQQMISIPSLKDYSRRQAEAQLNSLGFTNIVVVEVPAQFKGLVIRLEYKGSPIEPGEKIPKGSTIRMIVGGNGSEDSDMDEGSTSTQQSPVVDQSFF